MSSSNEIPPERASLGWEQPEAVLRSLRKQVALHEKLARLAVQQHKQVRSEDTRGLLDLLGRRDVLTKELTVLAADIEPAIKHWAAAREALTPKVREEASLLMRRIQTLMAAVMLQDETDARVLAARKKTTGDALGSSHRHGQALSAYRAPVDQGSPRGGFQVES